MSPVYDPDAIQEPSDDDVAEFMRLANMVVFSPGDVVDNRYEILELIGVGGWGSVYRVRQTALKEVYALKILDPSSASPEMVARFRKEAKAANRLEHPNLVKAVDFGMYQNKLPYMVMEYIEGPPLSVLLEEQGKLPADMVVELMIPLCLAMSYAHQNKVIHRDLKPANVIVVPDSKKPGGFVPMILDFGIAKTQFVDETNSMTLTKTGDVFGTPSYMSAEQCAGLPATERSDIYSMGCVLFECLTGTPPFEGKGPMEILAQHRFAKVPTLREASLGTDFPHQLEMIVARMLEKEPSERYQTFQDVSRDLLAYKRGKRDKVPVNVEKMRNQPQRAELPHLSPLVIGALAFLAGTLCTISGMSLMHIAPGDNHSPNKQSDEPSNNQTSTLATANGYYFWTNAPKLHESQDASAAPPDSNLIAAGKVEEFQKNGLLASSGVFVLRSQAGADTDASGLIHTLADSQKLQMLGLTDVQIIKPSFEDIGKIPNLKWLRLVDVRVKDGNSSTNGAVLTDPKDVAALPNLAKLKTLDIKIDDDMTPIFETLANQHSSNLRSLSVAPSSTLDQSALETISQISTLTTLAIHDYDSLSNEPQSINRQGEPINLSVLKHINSLQQLRLSSDLAEQNKQALTSLSNLRTLIVDAPAQSPLISSLKASLPDVQVLSGLEPNTPDWFDPVKTAPTD